MSVAALCRKSQGAKVNAMMMRAGLVSVAAAALASLAVALPASANDDPLPTCTWPPTVAPCVLPPGVPVSSPPPRPYLPFVRLPWDPKVDLALAKTQPRAGKTFLAVTAILQEPEKAKSADALCEAFLGERRLVGTAHNAYSSAGVL
ncbi:MAG: hypothetical protein H0U03_13060, partial [Actinobacteria bacterium]|nr:hypothetical protein [Actinomycetota bacterium]